MPLARRVAAVMRTSAVLLGTGVLAASCGGGGSTAQPQGGKAIYAARCATCHGVDGQGGVGPRLAGVVATRYPDIGDQVAVVTDGTGRMPAFGSTLDADQIRSVVEYTRTRLGA